MVAFYLLTADEDFTCKQPDDVNITHYKKLLNSKQTC